LDREFLKAVDGSRFVESELTEGNGQPQPGQPSDQGIQDHLQLHPGQGLAQTLVDAKAEGHMRTRLAGHVQPFRCREGALVVIGSIQHAKHAFAARDMPAADSDVFGRNAGRAAVHNRGVAQQFVAFRPSLIQGKPGWWTAELNRESRSTARTSACRVTNQGSNPALIKGAVGIFGEPG
jgi:hypothetical protein